MRTHFPIVCLAVVALIQPVHAATKAAPPKNTGPAANKPPAGPKDAPAGDAKPVLDAMAAAYGALNSLTLSGTWTTEQTNQNDKKTTAATGAFRAAYRFPDKFLILVEPPSDPKSEAGGVPLQLGAWICDGTTVVKHDPSGKYRDVKAAAPAGKLTAGQVAPAPCRWSTRS
jgi:hypothetical protein